MSARIHRIGTALPRLSLPQETSAAWAEEVSPANGRTRLIPALFKRTGVRRRFSVVLEDEPLRQDFFAPARDAADGGPTTRARMERYVREARPLALAAARGALGAARDVTHLVTVSCSGFDAPGFDVALIRDLGLDPGTSRTHVGFMGCHGALNGLRVARAYADADARARVLLCAVELCTLHYAYDADPGRIVANALFADGAAAALLSAGDGPWRHAASGSTLVPGTEDLMTWSIGDHGFAMRLSPEIPDVIRSRLRPWLDGWLAEHGRSIGTVASWAIHPGGPRLLAAVASALGLGADRLADSQAVLERCGNMSSPTLLFILDRLRRRGAPLPCVALGFGPGLTVEAALFD